MEDIFNFIFDQGLISRTYKTLENATTKVQFRNGKWPIST